MDKDMVLSPDEAAVPQKTGSQRRLLFFAIGTLLVLISTVLSVIILQPVDGAVDYGSLASPDEIRDGTVYLIDDMLCYGIFMYEGDAEQKGTPRNSGDGIFLEKEYVYSYHALAMTEEEDSLCLMIFSVDRNGGELFDTMAKHDEAENNESDPGKSFPVSVYAKAKRLDAEASAVFEESMSKHETTPGMDKVKWVFYEMEYLCDADEDYVAMATAEKREWLKLSLGILPIALLFIVFALMKPKEADEQKAEEDVPTAY